MCIRDSSCLNLGLDELLKLNRFSFTQYALLHPSLSSCHRKSNLCCVCAVEMSVTIRAVRRAPVRWNGLNLSVALTVLHTSRLVMLAASTHWATPTTSVVCLFVSPAVFMSKTHHQ